MRRIAMCLLTIEINSSISFEILKDDQRNKMRPFQFSTDCNLNFLKAFQLMNANPLRMCSKQFQIYKIKNITTIISSFII